MRLEPRTALYLSTTIPASPPVINLYDPLLEYPPPHTRPPQVTADGEAPTVLNYPADLPRRPGPPPFGGVPRLDRTRPSPDYPMSSVIVTLAPSDWAQPATHPYVDSLEIMAVAEDPSLSFAWPVTITNPTGILVEDVLQGIWANFHELVARDEYNNWDAVTRASADAACWRRSMPVDGARGVGRRDDGASGTNATRQRAEDGIRRIDWLGERVMFRGLERDEEGGWIIFIGPPS